MNTFISQGVCNSEVLLYRPYFQQGLATPMSCMYVCMIDVTIDTFHRFMQDFDFEGGGGLKKQNWFDVEGMCVMSIQEHASYAQFRTDSDIAIK